MSAIHTSRSSTLLASGQISRLLNTIVQTVTSWNDARITRNSLSKLTARELDDIGLTRSDIDVVISRTLR